MKHFLLGVALATVAMVGCEAMAQHIGSLPIGQTVEVVKAAFCESQDSAVEVAMMDASQGIEVSGKLFQAKGDCGHGGTVLTPRRVVISVKTPRGTTLSVVEVQVSIGKHSVIAYMLYEGQIIPAVFT